MRLICGANRDERERKDREDAKQEVFHGRDPDQILDLGQTVQRHKAYGSGMVATTLPVAVSMTLADLPRPFIV